MSKYVINIMSGKKNIATSKAKDDIAFFLQDKGYKTIDLKLFKNRWDKFLKTNKIIRENFSTLKKGDIFVLQYPTYLGYRFENKLIRFLKKKNVKIITLIHDIDSLRFNSKRQPTIFQEIKELNKTDFVITSNKVMGKLLKEKGLTTLSRPLEIFDYYQNENIMNELKDSNVLNYAGNLNKSKFIFDFFNDKNVRLRLFGNIDNVNDIPDYEEYLGSFPPEEITSQFKEGYGLVWDGESSKKIVGVYGEYLMYNNPHKLSLYLSSGMPVIFWKKAALADFVEKNNVGILVDSLLEVKNVLQNINTDEYEKMSRNAKKIGQKLIDGYFIKTAIEFAEERIRYDKHEKY